ncbi:pirin family protein, partial [Streptomyces sp. NPDC024062]
EGERTAVPDAAGVYVHVVRGRVRLAGEELEQGDAARITEAEGLELEALEPSEVLLWELVSL